MVLKKIGITGASGMVGRHLLAALFTRGVACAATSRQRPAVLPPETSWAPWDLEVWKSPKELDQLFPEVEAIFHVGASVPAPGASDFSSRAIFDANVRSSLCLGEWAREKQLPIIFLSGSVVYSDPDRSGILESDSTGRGGVGGLYGLTKLLSEQVLALLSRDGLKLCTLRPSSIYGYGLASGKMITDFLVRASQGETLELAPPVDDQVNLIHAADVAEAMLVALVHESWGVFNIGAPRAVTIREVAEACIFATSNGKLKILAGQADRPARVRFGLCSDMAYAKFGFTPKLSIQLGINRMWRDMSAARRVQEK